MVEAILIISLGVNVALVLMLIGFIRKTYIEKQRLINYGQALAYKEVLKTIEELVGK